MWEDSANNPYYKKQKKNLTSQCQASAGLKGNIFMIKINCTSVWYDTLNDAALSFPIITWLLASWTCYEHCTTLRACQERWRMMQLDFSCLFPVLWLTFHPSETSELCFPLFCWVCHIQHMPHIHNTPKHWGVWTRGKMRFLFISAAWQYNGRLESHTDS